MLTLILICIFLYGCGSENNEFNHENTDKDIAYTDMSSYKGYGGYIIENSIFDYREVFEKTYDWGENVYMPFPPMENAKAGFSMEDEDLSYSFSDVNKEDIDKYMDTLINQGFTVRNFEMDGYKKYLVYNDLMQITFIYKDNKLSVYVFYGFANESSIENKKIKELIDNGGALKDVENFDKYYILPLENKTVREAGFYEYIVLSEESSVNYEENLPYYMITDGKKILLFEQELVSIYFPSSSNIIKSNDKIQLTVTTSRYKHVSSYSQSNDKTGIFNYELNKDKFVKTEERFLETERFPDETYIGKKSQTEDKIEIWKLKRNENIDIKKGMKELYIKEALFDENK